MAGHRQVGQRPYHKVLANHSQVRVVALKMLLVVY